MNKQEIRQQLVQLESMDVVKKWFYSIHNQILSSSKAKEIVFAAKQSSEFFRNAENASYTVRPLLTYYAINTLSKALILLLKKKGGESSLKPGHGLVTKQWNNHLLGNNISEKLKNIGLLEVETCNGLFHELIQATNNRVSIHIYSEAVDWRLPYNIPENGFCFTFNELISRIPDLQINLQTLEIKEKFCSVKGLSYDKTKGFRCVVKSQSDWVVDTFKQFGYSVICSTPSDYTLICNHETLINNLPLFLHKYIEKSFGIIPDLYLVQPFNRNNNYSEIALTYLLSYYLGMLVRYYPTHWISLVNGENGDAYWPLLNRAQSYVETIYPELVIELINDILKEKH